MGNAKAKKHKHDEYTSGCGRPSAAAARAVSARVGGARAEYGGSQ